MHFQDSNWLKLALLSWDDIYRLRPRGVNDRDTELVREIRGESDLLRDVTPSPRDLDTVAEAFYELLERCRLLTRYGASRALRVASPPYSPFSNTVDWRNGEPDPEPIHRRELVWIYCNGIDQTDSKMARILRHRLVECGLARQVDAHDPWVGLHPKLGTVYLTALADTVARHNRVAPVTDDPRMHHAVGTLDRLADLLDQPVSPTPTDTQSAYAHLTLRAVLKPENVAAVSASRLLAFRQRYASELAAYRTHLESLAAELDQIATVENPTIAQGHLTALYNRTTKRQLDELRRALRAFGIESTIGTLGLKADLGAASGTVLGAAAAAGGHVVAGAAAVALTVVPYIAGHYKEWQTLRTTSPVAYLLAAEQKLN
jgi:Family of unknown function (DUF6236)